MISLMENILISSHMVEMGGLEPAGIAHALQRDSAPYDAHSSGIVRCIPGLSRKNPFSEPFEAGASSDNRLQ